ncbi:hypothetical protein BC937DRAFT_86199, partial [Endogone sp. FLAS-F59071]
SHPRTLCNRKRNITFWLHSQSSNHTSPLSSFKIMLSVLRSPTGIAIGWAAFSGTHLAMSHGSNREKLVSVLGEKKFLGLYSAVALATLIPTTWIYGIFNEMFAAIAVLYSRYGAGKGPKLWSGKSQFARSARWTINVLGAVTFSQAITTPSPVFRTRSNPSFEETVTEVKDEAEGLVDPENAAEPRGIQRVTRHALFLSFALLGLGQIMTRGHLGDIIYWGGYPAFFLVGAAHQDSRQKKVIPASFYDKTSLLPFEAIITGRNSWKEARKEMNWQAAGMAVVGALFVSLRYKLTHMLT